MSGYTFQSTPGLAYERIKRTELNVQTSSLILKNGSHTYNFIQAQIANTSVILPSTPITGLKFIIKNISFTHKIEVLWASTLLFELEAQSQSELIWDGVEWQIIIL